MAELFTIDWDAQRPILYITHGRGLWTNADFDVYERHLDTALRKAPVGGFDLLLDQSESTPQEIEVSNRRNATLNRMLVAGLKRVFVVAPGALMHMQTSRVNRQSGADQSIFTRCTTRAEALALLK